MPSQNHVEVRPTGHGSPTVSEELAHQRHGYSLSQRLYLDEEVYRHELDHIWYRQWLFAAASCEVPGPGDYVVVEVGAASVIVVRDHDGVVRAHHNNCRHRGSVVVTKPCGNTGRSLSCPYHQWVYGLDGSLRACRSMPADFDKSKFGLKPVAVSEFAGLIYVCLAADPPDINEAQSLMVPMADPQGLSRAKVAVAVDRVVEANWKLVWDNNRECLHCAPNHPQYVVANFDAYEHTGSESEIAQRLAARIATSEDNWGRLGLKVTHQRADLAEFPSPDGRVWWSANRTALAQGWVTESLDGTRVAPLMGDYSEEEVGVLRLRTMPNMWFHGSCDHAVLTRLFPDGPDRTLVRTLWLVDAAASEGRDYDGARLRPFWELTNEQDWTICERQHKGVASPAYEPGPLSETREYNVMNFHRWYLRSTGAEM